MLHYAVPEQVVDAIDASFTKRTRLLSGTGKIERPQSAILETVAPTEMDDREQSGSTCAVV
jgi:hypothetical protein